MTHRQHRLPLPHGQACMALIYIGYKRYMTESSLQTQSQFSRANEFKQVVIVNWQRPYRTPHREGIATPI